MTNSSDIERGLLHRPPKHLELLLSLVALLVIQSFLSPEEAVQRILLNTLFFAVVLAAIRSLSSSRVRLWSAMFVGLSAYCLSWLVELGDSRWLGVVVDLGFLVVFVLFILALSEDVFGNGQVDANRIIGAISIYFLLGVSWAFVYALLELIQPGSFNFSSLPNGGRDQNNFLGEFLYLSNITLTTVGYGDVLPVSRPAKMFASLEGMVGQVFIAVVIARLVGLHVSQNRDREQGER